MNVRKYIVKATLTDASGLRAERVEGIVARAEVSLAAHPDVFDKATGPVLVSGRLIELATASGRGIVLPPNMRPEFKDLPATLSPAGLAITVSKPEFLLSVSAVFDGSRAGLSGNMDVRLSGLDVLLDDLVFSGAAELVGEEAQPPAPSVPPDDDRVLPHFAVAGFTYAWAKAVADGSLGRACSSLAALCVRHGVDRSRVAFTLEMHGVLPGQDQWSTPDWKKHYAAMCKAYPEAHRIITSAGFDVIWFPWNTNTPGKGYSQSWNKADPAGNLRFIREQLDGVTNLDRTWLVPYNETDSSTPVSINDGLVAYFGGRVTKDRLISTETLKSWASRYDVHPQHVASLPTLAAPAVVTTDSGIVGELFEGGTWSAKRPRVTEISKLVDKYSRAHVPLFLYSLDTLPHFEEFIAEWDQILSKFSASWPVSGDVPPPVPGAQDALSLAVTEQVCIRNKMQPGPIPIRYTATDCSISGGKLFWKSNVPNHFKADSKGRLHLYFVLNGKVLGGHFDWYGPANPPKILSNLHGPEGTYFTVKPPPGSTVYLVIIAPDGGSRTQAVACSTPWPFSD